MIMRSFALGLVAAATLAGPTSAQETRLLRHPTASRELIAFAYGADLWVVPRSGGTARRLSATPGVETEPAFSPDGSLIAFTATVAGNTDVYLVHLLTRYYFAQQHKEGAIIDERYNQGGQVADYLVSELGRVLMGYFATHRRTRPGAGARRGGSAQAAGAESGAAGRATGAAGSRFSAEALRPAQEGDPYASGT